jgi:putative lipoprotein
MTRIAFLSMLFALSAGCASQAPTQVKGTATYLEQMALPPGAVFEATLEDVSKADAKAEVLGRARIENPGNPPIAFAIPYDASRVDPRHLYSVRARIVVGERLFFITDQSYPVLTSGHGNEVALRLRRTSGSILAGNEPLENTYWRLVLLGNQPVTVVANQGEPHFVLHRADKRISGSGGCNRITGSYALEGERLTFKQMAGTMMACVGGMDTERAFLDALQQVARARVTQQHLELLDASGTVLGRFEAVHLSR